MKYIPIETLDADKVKEMAADKEMDMIQSDMTTYATAFAQIKITGSISSELKECGIKAIKKICIDWGIPWNENEIQSKMIEDLQSFSFILWRYVANKHLCRLTAASCNPLALK